MCKYRHNDGADQLEHRQREDEMGRRCLELAVQMPGHLWRPMSPLTAAHGSLSRACSDDWTNQSIL